MALKLLINSLYRGGAEKQLAALAGLLPAQALFLLENEIAQATALSPVPLSSHNSRTSSLVKTAAIPLYARKLASLAGRGDTVLSFMERANIVNVLAARRGGHRSVICERTRPSGEFSGLRGLLMAPLIKRFYPLADIIVANSQGVKQDLAENFAIPAAKIRVIQNGCDTAGIQALAAEPLPAGWQRVYERPVVATSGRLTAAKGQWHLLRIFRGVRDAVPGAALVLAGDGELKGYLARLAARLGLKVFAGGGEPPPDADVYFAGFRENPYPFLAKARLFAFTSLWEGFPNALVEALACGVPVMAADCAAGPREILAPASPPSCSGLPEPSPYGLLMPALSGSRSPDAETQEEEALWEVEMARLLGDAALLARYRAAGLKRAGDFELARAARLWRELLGC
ncbi:MAG: glycosyltransferase [Elusimicrobiales bacterium]|nr:glycosyltransferase [Elusimicrobiales bacterium]